MSVDTSTNIKKRQKRIAATIDLMCQAVLDSVRMPDGYEVAPLNLHFSNPETERNFQRETLAMEIPIARLSVLLGCAMLGAFVIMDWYVTPKYFWTFLEIRLLFGCPLLVALIPISLLDIGNEARRRVIACSLFIPNISVLWMLAIASPQVAALYYVGLIVIMCFLVCLWRMGHREPLAASLMSVIVFNLVASTDGMERSTLVTANFFLIGSALTFVYLAYSRELFQRRAFAGNDILKRERIEIERLSREAEAANRAKSAFIATMNHELRTPLNAIIGFSEILHMDSIPIEPGQRKEYARDIHDSGQHLLKLINDILDISRAEAGMIQRIDDAFSPYNEAETVVRMLRERARRANIDLSMSEFPRNLLLNADSRLYRQALTNLVANAIKFTPEGGVVTISARTGDGEFSVCVTDTGIGIAAEELEQMFEPFTQSDNSLTRRFEGSGLGLAIVRQIAIVHGGRAWLESKYGRGTSATIAFPETLISIHRTEPHSAATSEARQSA